MTRRTLRRTWAAVLASAALLDGCRSGSQSPQPAKPAAVAWGQAVNGLQMGIVFIGGYRERDLRRTAAVLRLIAKYTGPEHRMPLVQALEAAAGDKEARYEQGTIKVLHQEVAGGSTLSAALLKYGLAGGRELIEGVKAGEAAGELPAVLASLTGSFEKHSRPRNSFVETEHFSVEVRLRNIGPKSISFPDHPAWLVSLTLTGEGTIPDVVCGPAPLSGRKPRMEELAPGAEVDFQVWSGLPKTFRDKPAGAKWAACPNGLPPGKYSLTAVCAHPEHADAACQHWHGRAASAPIGIEIRPDPTNVAWGPVADDLQLGLALRGAAAEGEWKRFRLCPDCAPRRPDDPPGVCRGCGRVTSSAYHRFCEPCATAKRVCQGCGAAQPSGGRFVEGEPIGFEARFRNFGDSDVVLPDAGHISQWRFEFVPRGGGEKLIGHYDTGIKEDRRSLPVNVPKRTTVTCVLEIGPRCVFTATGEGSMRMKDAKVLRSLPPGRYVMTATQMDRLRKLSTGPAEIEVTAKAAAPAPGPAISEARAREIALAAIRKRRPGYSDEMLNKGLERIVLTEDKAHWEVIWSWDNGIRGYRAEMQVDAESGEVEQFKEFSGI